MVNIQQRIIANLRVMAKRTSVYVALLAGGLAMLGGCATGPHIHTLYEPSATFTDYKTFTFLTAKPDTDAADKTAPVYLSLHDKFVQDAIRQQLLARGLREREGGQLLVAFNQATKEKLMSEPGFVRLNHCAYITRRGCVADISTDGAMIRQYTEGTLTIDLVDAEQKYTVWQGVAVGRLKAPKNNDLRDTIFSTVAQIFERYPQ